MKYCVHCGKELLDEAVACPYCGAATGDRNKGKRSKRVVITLVILLAAFILATGVFWEAAAERRRDLRPDGGATDTGASFGPGQHLHI